MYIVQLLLFLGRPSESRAQLCGTTFRVVIEGTRCFCGLLDTLLAREGSWVGMCLNKHLGCAMRLCESSWEIAASLLPMRSDPHRVSFDPWSTHTCVQHWWPQSLLIVAVTHLCSTLPGTQTASHQQHHINRCSCQCGMIGSCNQLIRLATSVEITKDLDTNSHDIPLTVYTHNPHISPLVLGVLTGPYTGYYERLTGHQLAAIECMLLISLSVPQAAIE